MGTGAVRSEAMPRTPRLRDARFESNLDRDGLVVAGDALTGAATPPSDDPIRTDSSLK